MLKCIPIWKKNFFLKELLRLRGVMAEMYYVKGYDTKKNRIVYNSILTFSKEIYNKGEI
jgi:hypothetical protein